MVLIISEHFRHFRKAHAVSTFCITLQGLLLRVWVLYIGNVRNSMLLAGTEGCRDPNAETSQNVLFGVVLGSAL